MVRIENGYIVLEFDQAYKEMPPGFDMDLDYFMTTAIENRRPIEGQNLPVKVFCKGELVYSDGWVKTAEEP